MDIRRLAILLIAPVAIITISVTVTRWCRAPLSNRLSANEVEPFPMDSSLTPTGGVQVSGEVRLACRAAAEQLEDRLGETCSTVIRPPFILAGDFSPDELQRCYRRTILPACRAMQNEYFVETPREPLVLLLFRNADSYNRHCLGMFGDRHISVYGYFKPEQRTVIVNLATGSGSLVHELTHALMASDFADAPPWLQEGLASLHEQAGFDRVDDQVVLRGRLNWRLHRLQQAASQGRLEPIEQILTTESLQGASEPLNYARARYLCLFLQQRGQLAEFYARFRDQVEDDPSGRTVLQAVMGTTDFDALNQDFAHWLGELKPTDR